MSDETGYSWPQSQDLFPTTGSYTFGERLSLVEFKGYMYVAFVQPDLNQVWLKQIDSELNPGGDIFVYESPHPIVEGSVSAATNGDETLSLVFTTVYGGNSPGVGDLVVQQCRPSLQSSPIDLPAAHGPPRLGSSG